jgi:23S rRNA (adenine2503-C2)-methyltransferase
MLTLEFILIAELNDTLPQARALAGIARELHAHVNLIPYNTVEGLDWQRPSITRQNRFLDELRTRGISVTLRREKGNEIDAACGQLRLRAERDALRETPAQTGSATLETTTLKTISTHENSAPE